MGFIVNLFRGYPEWHAMDGKADESLASYAKSHAQFRTSHGKPFQEFARKQPMQIQDTLFRLDGVLKQYDDAVAQGEKGLAEVRQRLEKLKAQYEDIRQKRKVTESVRDRAKKCEANAERAHGRLQALREHDPDYEKARDACNKAVDEKDRALADLSKRELEQEQAEKNYKRVVFETVLEALDAFARVRLQSCDAARPLAAQVAEVGGAFQFAEDGQVGEFRNNVQQLRTEPPD